MSFTKIKELTVNELVALAFVEYGDNRFTSGGLTSYLCSFLSDPFKVRSVRLVDDLLKIAESEALVQPVPGSRGGPGFKIGARGAEVVSDVDLPREKFERRAEADAERRTEAKANPGPVFSSLLKVIPQNEFRDREFINSVGQYWVAHGCLSSNQVTTMAAIGMRYGELIEQRNYIGSSPDEWRAPYLREQHRLKKEDRIRAQALVLAQENERKERDRKKALIKEANGKVKIALKEMERTGGLDELDILVAAVFPEVNMNPNAKALAFAGHGSKELRVCVAAVAFGMPPAMVWKNAGYIRQPDAESVLWQKLIEHIAFQAIDRRFKSLNDML